MTDLEYVHNPQEELTAKELYDLYRDRLPILVYIVQGFYGNREEMVFSTGQVLRLHSVKQQKRALVHDDRKCTLTVPLDYEHEFFVGQDRSRSFKLQQIVKQHRLPVKDVEFADPSVHFDLGDTAAHTFKKLNIMRVYDESYFLANTIAQGVPLDEVIPIPLYLKEVKFSVLVGLKGKDITDGGLNLMQLWLSDRLVSGIDFTGDHSDQEMVQLSSKKFKETDNIYENIQMNVYCSANHVKPKGDLAKVRLLMEPPPLLEGNVYDECGSVSRSQPEYQNFLDRPPERPPKPKGLKPYVPPPSSSGLGLAPGGKGDDQPSTIHEFRTAGHDQAGTGLYDSPAVLLNFRRTNDSFSPNSGDAQPVDRGDGAEREEKRSIPAPDRRSKGSVPSPTSGVRTSGTGGGGGGGGGVGSENVSSTLSMSPPPVTSAPARSVAAVASQVQQQHQQDRSSTQEAPRDASTEEVIYEIQPDQEQKPRHGQQPASAAAAAAVSAELTKKLQHQKAKMESGSSAQSKPATARQDRPVVKAETTTTLSMMPPQATPQTKMSASSPQPRAGEVASLEGSMANPFGVKLMHTAPKPPATEADKPPVSRTGTNSPKSPLSSSSSSSPPAPPNWKRLTMSPAAKVGRPKDETTASEGSEPAPPRPPSKEASLLSSGPSPPTGSDGSISNNKPPPVAQKPKAAKPSATNKPQVGQKAFESPPGLAQPQARSDSPRAEAEAVGSTSHGSSSQPEAFYVNQAEMLIVKPIRRPSSDSGLAESEKAKDTHSAQPEVTSSATMVLPGSDTANLSQAGNVPAKSNGEPVPWTVENMSIEDVKDILQQLKLTAYVDKFDEFQVDGVLLRELNKDVLMEDFGMMSVEATKLRIFVEKGHLPKVSHSTQKRISENV